MKNFYRIRNINRLKTPCVFDTWTNKFGAYFLDNGNSFFRIFTFPDVKNVILEVKPCGEPAQTFNMENTESCIWEMELAKELLKSGDRYRFILDYKDKVYSVKDPCSMWQDSYFKWSRIYDHSLYNWTDKEWMCNENPQRVSRLYNEENKLTPVDALRIYELHIGTLTDEGTFLSAKEKGGFVVS